MPSINPYLRAFFKSSVPHQCNPIHHHVLLVPTTECLLGGRDHDSDSAFTDLVSSEDFLASHVLRTVPPQAPEEAASFLESRGKAKQFNTLNGRTVVIKESFVYSNKGFRNLNQAQLLTDQLFYADTLESQQWLIYYISRPMIGTYEPVKITPAILSDSLNEVNGHNEAEKEEADRKYLTNGETSQPEKKDIKDFNDVLNSFPMIARQIQPGLEKVFSEFTKAINDWVPTAQSRRSSVTSQESSASATLKSNGSIHSGHSNHRRLKSPKLPVIFRFDNEAEHIRRTLETSVGTAIDLFQKVDARQLSLLGSTTSLNGPAVEHMIERYIAEQLHDSFLFPRLCNSLKMEDVELESQIYSMQAIDIAQVGINIENGVQGKNELLARIKTAAEKFRTLSAASSPHSMLEVLLETQKLVTGQVTSPDAKEKKPTEPTNGDVSEKQTPLAVNADTLVSLLLVVVIRAQVRHLHARLSYMQSFMFLDDTEAGETGYALSTLEAVLAYLSTDSAGLRKASQRNKRLIAAAKTGDHDALKAILEPTASPDGDADDSSSFSERDDDIRAHVKGNHIGLDATGSSSVPVVNAEDAAHDVQAVKKIKRVSMDIKSLSNASEFSYLSRSTTLDSNTSVVEGDTSVETLAQIQDDHGNSVLMIAVDQGQNKALEYLLSLESLFSLKFVLEDANQDETTLLSSAVQLGNSAIIDTLLRRIFEVRDKQSMTVYISRPDSRGRTVAHYMFHAPWLLPQLGEFIPWKQKDNNGQTPLLAFCRCYDHPNYTNMVDSALRWAAYYQNDGQLLHLDDHVESKGNTLLHVIKEPAITVKLLQRSDCDPNATNERRLTPLMVASKYGRMDLVKVFFADQRVDYLAKEQRGMTAVELAKDDEIRNRIDDMVLVSHFPGPGGRVTAIVRSFFVEDVSVRMIIKSAIKNTNDTISVTTCKRSLADFDRLAACLALEHPASWLPSMFNFRSPFAFPSKPSKAVLYDIQTRLDRFLKIMLSHSTFANHELLWEFILFPEIQPDMMMERSKKKAEIRAENISEEYEPMDDLRDVSSFVEHARDSLRGVDHSTKSVVRRVAGVRLGMINNAAAIDLCAKAIATLAYLPATHITAFTRYAAVAQMYASDPMRMLHWDMQSISETILAILSSLARPHAQISNLASIQKTIDRHESSIRRSDRWHLGGLLDETRRNIHADAQGRASAARQEWRNVSCELRYTQQTVAAELAGWQDLHAKLGRRAIRALAQKMVVREKDRLDGMRRALRVLDPNQQPQQRPESSGSPS